MRIALGIEYDGTDFRGWQSQQPGVRTVQGALEAALAKIANHPVEVVSAGRTDAGVHASGQVVHFDATVERPLRAWTLGANTQLPADVSVSWAQVVPDYFHARFSAHARRYRYVILNRPTRSALHRQRTTWWHRPLDSEAMQAAARELIGKHDFSSFRSAECQARSPVRELRRLEITRQGEFVILEAEANAFLHHMVRNIAGVLMAIGGGDQPSTWAREVLQARDRTQAGMTAPAAGLILIAVTYPDEFGLPPPPS
ncbi:MAG: tRNA pseudouridine(38-40) synthase TruA [Gammaproteobacteria bacterium]